MTPPDVWYNIHTMSDNDFTDGLILGFLIADRDAPRWRWIDFIVYGLAGIASAIVCGGIAYLFCR